MISQLIGLFAPVVALSVIVGFLILYGGAIIKEWRVKGKTEYPSEYTYVATLLSGLVAGVVAMTFNEELPKVMRGGPPGIGGTTNRAQQNPGPSNIEKTPPGPEDFNTLPASDQFKTMEHRKPTTADRRSPSPDGDIWLKTEYSPKAGSHALMHFVNPFSKEDTLAGITACYLVLYFVIGLASIVTWIGRGSMTSDLLRNMALISIGLFLAIARTFFALPS